MGRSFFEIEMNQQLEILQHSIGADQYGRVQRYSDRNYFITGPSSDDYAVCAELVERGLMTMTRGNEITGGGDVFRATDAGRRFVRENSEVDPNREWLCLPPWRDAWEWDAWFTVLAPTRSKARYQAAIDLADFSSLSVGELITKLRVKAKYNLHEQRKQIREHRAYQAFLATFVGPEPEFF